MNETNRPDLERVLRNLPKNPPPEGLASKIVDSLETMPPPSRPLLQRIRSTLQRPALTWAFRLATLVLLVAIFGSLRQLISLRRTVEEESLQTQISTGIPPDLPSQQAAPARVRVTFVFHAPEARRVSLEGNFNDGDPERDVMQTDAEGRWTAELDIPPGRYEYQFVVDGSTFVPDPEALEWRDDGFGRKNAVLRL